MSLKKMLLPLSLVALAAGVLVGPATASAAEFLHEGSAASGQTVEYTGHVWFENEAGGVTCHEATIKVIFNANDAEVESFIAHECETTGLLAAFGCVVEGGTAYGTNYNWTVDLLTTEKAEATNVKIGNPVNAGCPFADENGEITVSGNVSLTTPKAGSANELTLGGTLISPTVGEATAGGTVTSMSPGTITIE
jgi:hypothetical protein